MDCRAIACDYDGTGATGGHLAPEVAAALNRCARRASSLSSLPAASSTTCGSRSSTSRPSKRSSRKAARSCGTQRATARSSSALRPAMDSSAGCAPQVLPSTRAWTSWRPGTPHVPELIRLVRETGVDLQLLFDRAAAAVGYQQGRRDAAGTGRTRPVAAQPRRVRRRGECPAARCPGQSSPWRLEVRFRPSPPPPMIACASREPRAWWLGSPSFSNETARCPHRGGSPSTSAARRWNAGSLDGRV